jgi:lipopolysaccharide export system protein LptA
MQLRGLRLGLTVGTALLAAHVAYAQATSLAFGEMSIDPEAPIEVSADQLSVSQPDGAATFSGNVRVAQGELRISADEMRIEYVEGADGARTRISRLLASGDVMVVTPSEAAEAQEAVYSIDGGTVVMTGEVLLTQGANAISGDRLSIDLVAGTGTFDGRVRTVLQGSGN